MRPALYVFVNRGLGMSAGKIAAQVVQASIGAYRITPKPNREAWWGDERGNHHATYVMLARDEMHLAFIERYIRERGFKTFMMIDEGMTEIEPITPTALAVEVVDKDDEHTDATFSIFQLYRDTVRLSVEVDR